MWAIMGEKYKDLPEDDQVIETFDKETGELINDPYADKVYKEWQVLNLNPNYLRGLHLNSVFEEKNTEQLNSFCFGNEALLLEGACFGSGTRTRT